MEEAGALEHVGDVCVDADVPCAQVAVETPGVPEHTTHVLD